MSTRQPARDNRAELTLAGPYARAVLHRVLPMMAARADCTLDTLDDALLVADALTSHVGGLPEPMHFDIRASDSRLIVTAGPVNGAQRVIAAAEIPGIGNVLELAARSVTIDAAPRGNGEILVLELGPAAA